MDRFKPPPPPPPAPVVPTPATPPLERVSGLVDVQEIGLGGADDADEKDTGRNATTELRDDTDDDVVLEANVAETVVYGIWSRLYRRLFCSGG